MASMKYASKSDANQQEIIDSLRYLGWSVHATHRLGSGFPDIVVGVRGENWLFEIKNPEYDCKLTDDEQEFFDTWQGQVHVITTAREAIEYINAELDE